MTKLFHEGQEVEVWQDVAPLSHAGAHAHWRKAKIVDVYVGATYEGEAPKVHSISVQFPDGTRAVVDAEHIRLIEPTVFFKDGDPSNPIVYIAGKVSP